MLSIESLKSLKFKNPKFLKDKGNSGDIVDS